ncbi:hypothetical protein VYU27_006138 [Nannochloropsis oceanica]
MADVGVNDGGGGAGGGAAGGGQARRVVDALGQVVRGRFTDFLQTFRLPHPALDVNLQNLELDDQEQEARTPPEYLTRLDMMVLEDRATLLVDYNHLRSHDPELAQALEAHYYRVEMYLRLALRQSLEAALGAAGADFLVKLKEKRTELGVGFYNFPRVVNIRMLRADRIGRLSAVAGREGGGKE